MLYVHMVVEGKMLRIDNIVRLVEVNVCAVINGGELLRVVVKMASDRMTVDGGIESARELGELMKQYCPQ